MKKVCCITVSLNHHFVVKKLHIQIYMHSLISVFNYTYKYTCIIWFLCSCRQCKTSRKHDQMLIMTISV